MQPSISIVICSREKDLSFELKENINSTIGCAYNLIVIDNSLNKYSIFEAYNIGLQKSNTNIVCFIHDDILVHTKNWGNKLISLFEKNIDYGLIGVAGSKVKSKTPGGWWDCAEKYRMLNIIQHIPNKEKQLQQFGFTTNEIEEAVVIDGLLLALHKKTNIRFNDEFKGFHNYDLSISFEVKKNGYKVGVTNEVLVEHFSYGNPNLEWLNSAIQIHNYYKEILPLSLNNKKEKINIQEIETYSLTRLIDYFLKFGKRSNAIRYWFNLMVINPFSNTHVILFKRIFKKIKF